LDQRQWAQVPSIQVQEVEGDKDALPFAENQIAKCRPAGFVEAGNLGIEYGAFDAKMFGDPGCEFCESVKGVAVLKFLNISSQCNGKIPAPSI
jgi:hypothetical protein